MTPNELRELCQSNKTPLAFAEAFSDLDDSARKALSKTAQDIYREVRKTERADPWREISHREALARLALLACCPWSQAKRVHGPTRRLFGQGRWSGAIVKILTDRRPDWATDWVNLQLDGAGSEWQGMLTWHQLQYLIKSEVIERPTSDGYVRTMATAVQGREPPVIDDEVIEQDIWRLFEVDTGVFYGLRSIKDIDREAWAAKIHEPIRRRGEQFLGGGGWPRVLYHLAATGRIDRGRLIDATLSAFWRDFNTQVLSSFVSFHDLLEPTDDEIADREQSYRELMRREYGPVVDLALKTLGQLQKARRLDVAAFLEAVPAVFAISAKAQPNRALSLIDRAAKKPDDLRASAIPALAAALNHESPDVQEKALGILAKWKKVGPSLDLSAVVESATMTAPQHRHRLRKVAGAESAEPATDRESTDAVDAVDLVRRERDIREHLAALPTWIREVTCLSDIDQALQEHRLPAVFDPSSTACPVLSGVEAIAPIQDVDQLIDVINQHLTGSSDPADTERIVDAVFRLGQQTTDNFEAKTEGVRTAIRSHLEIAGRSFVALGAWELAGLQLIIGRWLRLPLVSRVVSKVTAAPKTSLLTKILGTAATPDIEATIQQANASVRARLSPLDWKFAELFQRLDRDQYGPVLSTPTHKSGWIDPPVFVARCRETQTQGLPIGKRDFIGGLLRLAPDHRQHALRDAAHLQEPHRRIVCYALGGEQRPMKKDRPHADEWLAAGRARAPHGHLTELQVLNLSPDEPDGVTAASYEVNRDVSPSAVKYRWSTANQPRYVRVTPDKPGEAGSESRPTVALAGRVLNNSFFGFFDDTQQFQLASVTPLNTDSILAVAAQQLLSRIDDKGSAFEPVGGLLSPLLAIDRPWTDIARAVLWLGLLSRDDQARGIAIDALIEGIADGRADVDRLSATLLHIAGGGWIKLNRLADALREVSRTSVLSEKLAADILDRLIASWQSLPRDGHHVLSLQVELLANLQQAPSPEAAGVLGGVKGSGKAAKLARQICALKTDQSSPTIRLAVVEAAEGRLKRATRIARQTAETA